MAAAVSSRPRLTPRNLEVLALVADGLSSDEIGGRLYLSPETVKSHIRRVLQALGARNRAHAVAIAYQAGVLQCSHELPEPS